MTTETQNTAGPQTLYEREFVHMMDDIDRLIDSTTEPLHRKILINYRRHGLLEVSSRYEELLDPTMTARHPQYRLFEGGQGVILEGMEQVKGFYRMLADMDMLVMWTGKQRMAVFRLGVCRRGRVQSVRSGQDAGRERLQLAGRRRGRAERIGVRP